jgi:hypothetical protein
MKLTTIFILDRKNKKVLTLLSCLLVLMAFITSAFANYEISWSTIDGGGGRSAGGQYILTGTIGQPDTGSMSSGQYELLGGFWLGGPLCIVNFHDFAVFAQYWLETGIGLPADLDKNGVVDIYDLKLFADVWLCVCPYNWPLR